MGDDTLSCRMEAAGICWAVAPVYHFFLLKGWEIGYILTLAKIYPI